MDFREFLKDINEAEEYDPLKQATTLSRTLGRKLVQKGWSTGSRGSGIVAMIDSEDGKSEEAVGIINAWLKTIKSNDTMKKVKLAATITVK